MIQCPWCEAHVIIGSDDICPECMHEVLLDNKGQLSELHNAETTELEQYTIHDVNEWISERFECSKCRHNECRIQEVAMTGGGISKLLDIQYNHYLFVSCYRCSNVTIYDPNILHGKIYGKTSTILDLFFG